MRKPRLASPRLDPLCLIQVCLGSDFCLSILEMAGLQVPLCTSETLLCSLSGLHVNTVPLLDVYQLLILFAAMLMHSEPRNFTFITCYNILYLLLLLLLHT